MQIKTLIAAAAFAGMSSTAFAQNVTTPTGEVVLTKKNQGNLQDILEEQGLQGLGGGAAAGITVLMAIAAIAAVGAGGGT
jgi:hypothetical protein